MPEDYLDERLEWLRATQNADGGWGYVAGKQSWIEPTAYAMLALHGQPGADEPLSRAWPLLAAWQAPSGAWRPAANVERESWATALAVTLHCARGMHGKSFVRAVDWLLATRGAEGSWLKRLLYLVQPKTIGSDPSLQGWPWLPGTGSWVEPTCHALVALRLAAPVLEKIGHSRRGETRRRLRLGEKMMLQRRAVDGGWNYGNRIVLGEELPSYPETTGLALVGMLGCPDLDASGAVAVARRQFDAMRSPLARAWLAIGLRLHGAAPADAEFTSAELPRHTHVVALEALAAPGGNARLLAPTGNGVT